MLERCVVSFWQTQFCCCICKAREKFISLMLRWLRALHLEESRHKQCKFKIMMEKRELVALPSLSSWCLVIVVWLFLAVTWVCLQFVVVVFPIILTYYFVKKCDVVI